MEEVSTEDASFDDMPVEEECRACNISAGNFSHLWAPPGGRTAQQRQRDKIVNKDLEPTKVYETERFTVGGFYSSSSDLLGFGEAVQATTNCWRK